MGPSATRGRSPMGTAIRTRCSCWSASIRLVVFAALLIDPSKLAAQSTPTVAVTPATVGVGGRVTVTVTNGPGSPTDWVGLSSTAAHDTLIDWAFLNGPRVAPATGVSSATLTFTMRRTAGLYQVRFFPNNTYNTLATSALVTVQSMGPALSVTAVPTTVGRGGTITVAIANW